MKRITVGDSFVFHPAIARPAMYVGEKGNRTIEQWLIDALEAYRSK